MQGHCFCRENASFFPPVEGIRTALQAATAQSQPCPSAALQRRSVSIFAGEGSTLPPSPGMSPWCCQLPGGRHGEEVLLCPRVEKAEPINSKEKQPVAEDRTDKQTRPFVFLVCSPCAKVLVRIQRSKQKISVL